MKMASSRPAHDERTDICLDVHGSVTARSKDLRSHEAKSAVDSYRGVAKVVGPPDADNRQPRRQRAKDLRRARCLAAMMRNLDDSQRRGRKTRRDGQLRFTSDVTRQHDRHVAPD